MQLMERTPTVTMDLEGHINEVRSVLGKIPIGAIEQHLEHLAMEHDWRSVCHVADPRPSLATEKQEEEFINRIVDRVADYLQEMIAGKRVAEIPSYFP